MGMYLSIFQASFDSVFYKAFILLFLLILRASTIRGTCDLNRESTMV